LVLPSVAEGRRGPSVLGSATKPDDGGLLLWPPEPAPETGASEGTADGEVSRPASHTCGITRGEYLNIALPTREPEQVW